MILPDVLFQCPRTHAGGERLLFADQFFTGMVEQRFHDNGLLEDFLDGREVFIGGFGLFLGGAAEDDIVETVMAGRPEGVWFDENAFRTELLDGRQLESDFEMPPLIDPRIAAEKRLAIDLQVVTFA